MFIIGHVFCGNVYLFICCVLCFHVPTITYCDAMILCRLTMQTTTADGSNLVF